jgi:phycobilisome rod-core linker protein
LEKRLFMALPLLEYAPSSQNQRVANFEVPGDEQSRIYTTDNLPAASEMDALIAAAYRQIFNEQQMTVSSRQLGLESQLRSRQITVKEFIRGLASSSHFRERNYDSNSNYRFAQMCIQRILGRDVYSDREKLAWSTVLATQGLQGFIDALIDSDEYRTNFGEHTVPYQRRRILPQHSQGELPFARMARYDDHYRKTQPKGNARIFGGFAQFERFNLDTFLRQADLPVLAGTSMVATAVIVLLLAIAISAQSL